MCVCVSVHSAKAYFHLHTHTRGGEGEGVECRQKQIISQTERWRQQIHVDMNWRKDDEH